MPDERIESERIMAFGVSEDGQTVRLELSANDDGKVYVTMPVGNVAEFYRALGELLTKLRQMKLVRADAAAPQAAGKWLVGTSDNPNLRQFTALAFDQGTVAEKVYIFGDIDALAIADAIERNVYKKLTAEEKRQLDLMRKKARGPQIILPGDVHQ
jgi:hypothetical protein